MFFMKGLPMTGIAVCPFLCDILTFKQHVWGARLDDNPICFCDV